MKVQKRYRAGAKAGTFAGVPTGVALWTYIQLFVLQHPFSYVGLMAGGVGFVVGFALVGAMYSLPYVWLYEKLPGKNSVVKAEILLLLLDAIAQITLYIFTRAANFVSTLAYLVILLFFGLLLGEFYPRFAKLSPSSSLQI